MNRVITLLAVLLTTLFFANCKKEKRIVQPDDNAKSTSANIDTAALLINIGGVRYWTGTNKYAEGSDSFSSPVNQVFEVINNGDNTINVESYTLTLENIDTIMKTIRFSYQSSGTMSWDVELEYYYLVDSMTLLDVSVLAYGITIKTETRQIHTWPGPGQQMSGITGLRHWTGSNSWQNPGSSGSQIVNDSFEVLTLSNAQISVQNNVLNFSQIDTIQKKLKFNRQESSGATTIWYVLDFYYEKDSMNYFQSQHTGLGGSSLYSIHTVQ